MCLTKKTIWTSVTSKHLLILLKVNLIPLSHPSWHQTHPVSVFGSRVRFRVDTNQSVRFFPQASFSAGREREWQCVISCSVCNFSTTLSRGRSMASIVYLWKLLGQVMIPSAEVRDEVLLRDVTAVQMDLRIGQGGLGRWGRQGRAVDFLVDCHS